MITKVAISGYRSLRDVRLALGSLNVVTGPNGSGKSSLYRALRLLADVAQGLNEPETSLHPDLLPPLARLIAQAAKRSQLVVVSHATALVSALAGAGDARQIVLDKQLGETLVQCDDRPAWTWPTR